MDIRAMRTLLFRWKILLHCAGTGAEGGKIKRAQLALHPAHDRTSSRLGWHVLEMHANTALFLQGTTWASVRIDTQYIRRMMLGEECQGPR